MTDSSAAHQLQSRYGMSDVLRFEAGPHGLHTMRATIRSAPR